MSFINKYFLARPDKSIIQFFRYLIVGGMATIIDLSAFFILTHWGGIHYLFSAALAFLLGLITNYIFSIYWVFQRNQEWKKEFSLFAVIGIGGLIWNELILLILVEKLNIYYMLAKAIAVILVLFWNFFMRKKFCFS